MHTPARMGNGVKQILQISLNDKEEKEERPSTIGETEY